MRLLSGASAADCHIQKLQTIQNKTLRHIHKAPRYLSNFVIHRDFNIETIREFIKKNAINFWEAVESHPNEEIHNLQDYDPREQFRRPRATTIMNIGLTPHY